MCNNRKFFGLLAALVLGLNFSFAVTYDWNTWVAGALTYSTSNMTATVTNTNFATYGPQDPNGGANNGYKSPKYISAATINTYQGGFTNDYGLPGLVLSLDWPNLSSSTTVTITFTTPVAGPVSFSIYDINTGSWGGNDPVWIDKITIAGTNCAGATVYPAISGCGNTVSGANNNIITGRSACTNSTNTITFNAPTLKTITITYASGSPLASGYGTDPDPQYIVISSITASNAVLADAVASSGGITCTSATATLSGSSSAANATYAWTGPNSTAPAGTTPSSSTTSVSAGGTYVLAVTDPSSGCVFNDTVVVNQNVTAPGASIAPPASLDCSVSSVTLTASSPTGGVTYSWSGGGNSASKTVSAAGTYTVTVTNPANGCSSTATTNVSSNGSPLSISTSSLPANCGNANGSATVSITAGTATGYSWSNGNQTAMANNLGGGNYTVTVTGSGGCSATASVQVVSTGGLSVSASSTNTTCGKGNGSATVSISAGTATGYNWSNGAQTATVTNLAAGTYTVTVTGPGGCSATASAQIAGSAGLVLNTSSTTATCGVANGTATVSVTGGTNLTYLWSTGDITSSAVNLAGGSYRVTVTDIGGCSASVSIPVNSTAAVSFTVVSTPSACGNANGTAMVDVQTGVAAFYNWSNGTSGLRANNLAAGIYSVTVASIDGCLVTDSVTISTTPGLSLSVSSTPATCNNANGSAAVNASGGTATGYLWSNGATGATANNLQGGNYSVTVTDANTCTSSAVVTVNASGAPGLTTSTIPTTCGNNNGSATVTIVTGAATAYSWSSGGTSATTNNLPAGPYSVTVTGSNGCTAVANVVVAASSGLTVSTSSINATCGNSNGSAVVRVLTGNGPYAYLWSNNSTLDSVTQLSAATYTVTVTGAGGCSATASVVVNGSSAGPVNATTSQSVICAGDSAVVCAPTGFATYLWNTGATTSCITTRLAGNYYLTVTDNSGCSATSNRVAVTVRPQPPVSISVNGDSLLSYNSNSYQWYFNGNIIQGATSPLYIAPQAGSYTVLVTDTNGCSALSLPVVVGTTSVEAVAEESLTIYPNPMPSGNDGWTLLCNLSWIGSSFELFDAEGRLIYKSVVQGNKQVIDIPVARGVYLARITNERKSKAFRLAKL